MFDCIEAYAPGFKGSVVGRDILTPPDLERIFGLPGGVRISVGSLITFFSLYPTPWHAPHTAFTRREDSGRAHGGEGTEEGPDLGSGQSWEMQAGEAAPTEELTRPGAPPPGRPWPPVPFELLQRERPSSRQPALRLLVRVPSLPEAGGRGASEEASPNPVAPASRGC